LYRWDENTGAWTQQARLVGSGAAPGELHGWTVDVQDDEVFVGAQLSQSTGAVYVFRPTPVGTWVERQRLVPSGTNPGDRFGFALDAEGEVLVVGAPSHRNFE